MVLQTFPTIIPYCIYHYVDIQAGIHYGLIGNPSIVKLKNGLIKYSCSKVDSKSSFWKLKGIFYGVSPLTRPIPVGMKIICAMRNKGFPHNTVEVSIKYDPFNVEKHDTCIEFINYTQPVPNTVPLYFHKNGENVFPSFDKNPPTNDPSWYLEGVNPIFVMTPEIFGPDPDKIRFNCKIGRCLPTLKETDTSNTLLECILRCNELEISKDNSIRATNVLERIEKLSSDPLPSFIKTFENTRSYMIGFIISVFILLLFYVMITFLKNKNDIKNRNTFK